MGMKFYAKFLLYALIWLPLPAHSALFQLVYDDVDDQQINAERIIGSGTFSYTGEAQVGTFALSSLSDISYEGTINGIGFSTSNILTLLDVVGITIFDRGEGELGLLFTGLSGLLNFGSLELQDSDGEILTHEPTFGGVSDPFGAFSGSSSVHLYQLIGSQRVIGDYSGTLVRVSVIAPPSAGLLVLSALIWIGVRRRYSHFGQ
ncbi:MAG: hypothetical protein Hals2KO_28750 [Halioglobus sp.]